MFSLLIFCCCYCILHFQLGKIFVIIAVRTVLKIVLLNICHQKKFHLFPKLQLCEPVFPEHPEAELSRWSGPELGDLPLDLLLLEGLQPESGGVVHGSGAAVPEKDQYCAGKAARTKNLEEISQIWEGEQRHHGRTSDVDVCGIFRPQDELPPVRERLVHLRQGPLLGTRQALAAGLRRYPKDLKMVVE